MERIEKYTVREGDTIRGIAQKVLLNANKWSDIVIYNQLDYPFIVGMGYYNSLGVNVKKPGDVILIPVEILSSSVTNVDVNAGDLIFGSDFMLSRDDSNLSQAGQDDLKVDTSTLDYAVVSGIQCLKQDLVHRLRTKKGTLVYHPEYGSNFMEIIGNKGDTNWRDKAVIELIKTFRSDSRVVDVLDVSVTSLDESVSISCKIVTSKGSYSIYSTL